MTEEKPVPEQNEKPEQEERAVRAEEHDQAAQSASNEPVETLADLEKEAAEATVTPIENVTPGEADGIAAALSALSSAAAPVRDGSEPASAPNPENVNVTFTPAAATFDASSQSEASAPASESNQSKEPSAQDQTPPPPPPAPESATDAFPAPTGAPIAVNASPASAVPPAPTAKRAKWPWILAICIVAFLLVTGSVVACTASVMSAAFQDMANRDRLHSLDDMFNHGYQEDLWDYYYGDTFTSFDDLLDYFDVEEGEITASGSFARGAYRVGGEDGIAPGLYYLEGSQSGVSNFYVFHDDDDNADDPNYRTRISVEYFGNYYTQLEDGDAIVFVPFSPSSTMHIASDQPMDVVPPYQSGCYRVGIDIPAGTYTITCDAEAARETDSEAGAYVMSDLDFNEDSIVESAYIIKGGRQTITVEAGEYLELFAAIATPATASTRTPLQHIESESSHAA